MLCLKSQTWRLVAAGKSQAGGEIVQPPPVTIEPAQSSLRRSPPFVSAKNNEWLSISSTPRFILHPHVQLDPLNRFHFFLPVTLSIPNRSDIKTFAFIDSGSSGSHISDIFSKRHSLPCTAKTFSVPIFTVDDRPLSSGLLTHDVITQAKVRNHIEIIRLGIVTMPYPVLLGLNWLKQHNPAIDWARGRLALSCCGADLNSSVSAVGKGYSLPDPSDSDHISSLALGSRLPSPSQNNLPDLDHNLAPKPEVFASGTFANAPKPEAFASGPSAIPRLTPSIFQPPIPNGLSQHKLKSPLPSLSPPISVSHVSPERFLKYSKNQHCYCIWYTPNEDHINSLSTEFYEVSISPNNTPQPDDKTRLSVPPQFHDFLDVFSPTEVKNLPPHHPYDISIDLEDGTTPPFGPIYSLSLDERKALSDYIQENLAKGFIQRSTSSASSPILFTKRKTGDLCLCVDYRGLNAITKKNRYPLPLTHDLIDRVAGCSCFTVIDLKNAFNLIRVKKGDEWKTAFRTHLSLYEYTVMPYGLTNAPATFQAFIQDTLHDILDHQQKS